MVDGSAPHPSLRPARARRVAGEGRTRPGGARRGFSLLELTVAVVLLEVGILALAATAAGVLRLAAVGKRGGASSLVAAARLDDLRDALCARSPEGSAGETGAAITGPYRERWTVASEGGLLAVRLDVSYPDGAGMRTDIYETAVACAR